MLCKMLPPLLFALIVGIDAEEITLSTPLGDITGISSNNGAVYQFRGIPYAKAPVGNLRFAKPQPYGAWGGTLNATSFKTICVQQVGPDFPIPMSEDCLFLNIYVPRHASSMKNKAVMVWIHGGAYISGAGQFYNGSNLATQGDVIVVSINYRLGLFGFLTLGNDAARGNYGLWDQILALKWVSKYISAFGGNPSSVTIFGESAGGLSVSLLSLIPSNRGLFQRVIAQSGVANSMLATTPTGVKLTADIGSEVSCLSPTTNPNSFLTCMRGKSSEDLENAYITVTNRPDSSIYLGIQFAPVIDHELFMDSPENILSGPISPALVFFRSLDLITGTCNSEGSLALALINPIQDRFNLNTSIGIPNSVLKNNILPRLVKDFLSNNQEAENAICARYCEQDTVEQSRQFLNMYGDMFFVAPSVHLLNTHAQNNTKSSTYQYIFSRRRPLPGGFHYFPSWFTGAGHGADIEYVFDTKQFSDQDLSLANDIRLYWSNFAKHGNPNGGPNKAAWPAYDTTNQYYLRLDLITRAEMQYHSNRMKFWLKDIPNIMKSNTGSHSVDLSLMFPGILGRK